MKKMSIYFCKQCKDNKHDIILDKLVCITTGKTIENEYEFPEECPLEDAEED